ncbi:MAG: Crp/Fnr family transcriptional regulator [Microscillaceae bacterium]|jgi:CRP/FNR family transcriptional regulator|nr:Crp/Fnr family transcriptional regulator [Microscillaceae bacterium]
MEHILHDHFPIFAEKDLKEQILKLSQIAQFPENEVLLKPGQYIKLLPLVISGSLKVIREDEEGNEILLYYIRSGESCAISLSAYLNRDTSEVKAITTEASEILLVPTQYIDNWLRLYPSWQSFALKLYNRRFEELLQTIDNIAFKKMDERLLKYLQIKVQILQTNRLEITHQAIANDLGTSREVISRLLKQLEKDKIIRLSRNYLEILQDLNKIA